MVDVWQDEVNDCKESLYFILSVVGSIVVLILYLILCCKCCRKRKEKQGDVEKSPQTVEIPKMETPEKPKREDLPAKSSPASSPAESGGETPPPMPKRPSVSRGPPPALPSAPKPRLSPTTPQSDTSPRVETEFNPPAPVFPFISHLPRESEESNEPANPEPQEPREPQAAPEPRGSLGVSQFPPIEPTHPSDPGAETPQMAADLPPNLPPNLPPEKPSRAPPKLPPRPLHRTSTSGSITAGMRPSNSGNSGNSGNPSSEINEAIYPKPSRHVEAPPRHVLASNEMNAGPAENLAAAWTESSVYLNPADVTIAGNRCTLRNMAYEMDVVEMSQVPRFSEAQLSREKEFWSQLYHPGIVRVPKIGGFHV